MRSRLIEYVKYAGKYRQTVWNDLGSGEKFNVLDSPKCRYYAFLSKVEDVSPKDMPIEDQTWTALFEIVPYEWIESLPSEIWDSKSPLPISPAS